MKGQIRKRSKDSWSVIVYLGRDPVTGKERRKWYTVKGTKKEAEKYLTELLHQINTTGYVDPGKLTFGDYLTRWLEDYAKANVTPSTFRSYKIIVNAHVKPVLGNVLLAKLSPLDIQSYLTKTLTEGRKSQGKEGEGLSPSTVLRHFRVIHEALDHAVKWGLVMRNVADAVDPPKKAHFEMQPLDQGQVCRFLEVAKETRNYVLYLAAVTTGMRQGELLGLRWEDVDLEKATASVRQILAKPGRNPVFKEPKTPKSRRQIALFPVLVEALKKHKAQQNQERLLWGSEYKNYGLVFAQPNGNPLDGHNITNREFPRLLENAGLPKIRFHDLRHTHATLLLQEGVHPKIVSERLGHSAIGITLDTYSHVLPNMQREVVKTLDKKLFG